MTLFETLSSDRNNARKLQDKFRVTFLGTIMSEASRIDKEPSDEYVYKILSRFKQSSLDLISAVPGTDLASAAELELTIISEYLPDKLSPERLKEVVIDIANELSVEISLKNMKTFKSETERLYPGRIDGSLLAEIVKGKS